MQDLKNYQDRLYEGRVFMIVYSENNFPKLTIGVFKEFPNTNRPVVVVNQTVSYHTPISIGNIRIPHAIKQNDSHEILRAGERIYIGEQEVFSGLNTDETAIKLAANYFKFISPEKELPDLLKI